MAASENIAVCSGAEISVNVLQIADWEYDSEKKKREDRSSWWRGGQYMINWMNFVWKVCVANGLRCTDVCKLAENKSSTSDSVRSSDENVEDMKDLENSWLWKYQKENIN